MQPVVVVVVGIGTLKKKKTNKTKKTSPKAKTLQTEMHTERKRCTLTFIYRAQALQIQN
jgi:hypothetical protein